MKFSNKYLVYFLVLLTVCAGAVAWQINRVRHSRFLSDEVLKYRLLADSGDSTAQEVLGTIYDRGRGVPPDLAQALRLYASSAQLGNAKAQYELGRMYELGRGVDKDYAKAMDWYQKAASRNNPDAQCSIGSLYYYGRGVEQNTGAAAVWFKRASDQGLARADFNLGVLYDRGRGVPRNPEQSYKYFQKAASQGYDPAERTLGLKSSIDGPWTLIALTMLLGYLWILKGTKLPAMRSPISGMPAYQLGAILGLLFLLAGILRLIFIFHTVETVTAYAFIEYLLLGASLATSFGVFTSPRGNIRVALAASGAASVGITVFILHQPGVTPYSPVYRDVWSVDGLLAGIAILSAASLIRKRAKRPVEMAT